MEEEIDYENTETEYEDDGELSHDEIEKNIEEDFEESSDEPEDDGVEEQAEEEPEEPKNEKPSKIDIRERLSQVQRERYQVLQEADALRQENERLRKSAEIAAGQALYQYDENLNRRLEIARAEKARAMEEGDVQQQIDADYNFSRISQEMYQNDLLKAKNDLQASQYQPPVNQYPDNRVYANQWVQENSWFNSASQDFDEELAHAVDAECREYDLRLKNNGLGHYVMSPGYLNEVSQYAENLRNLRNQSVKKRELNMRQSRSPISPVRNGYSQSAERRQSQSPAMSAAEKDMAARFGVKNEQYLQQKVKYAKDHGHKV